MLKNLFYYMKPHSKTKTKKKQEGMSPPSTDMTCGRPSSCRSSRVQAPNNGKDLVCSWRLIRLRLIGRP